MTDVKRLLDEATPLPWIVQKPGDNDPGASTVHIDTHAYEDGPEPVIADSYPLNEADAALIVHAVNTLPAYEAAVDALAHFVATMDGIGSLDDVVANYDEAREALRAVRGES